MSLPARAENVAVVRHALAGLAERLGMDEASLADLKTVVTEACMNVVVHAYAGSEPGPLEVEAETDGDGLTVVVRDHGGGIRPRPDVERPSLRIGLTADRRALQQLRDQAAAPTGAPRSACTCRCGARRRRRRPARPSRSTADEETRIRVGPPEIVGPVLSRALSALWPPARTSASTASPTRCCSATRSPPAPRRASPTATSRSASPSCRRGSSSRSGR